MFWSIDECSDTVQACVCSPRSMCCTSVICVVNCHGLFTSFQVDDINSVSVLCAEETASSICFLSILGRSSPPESAEVQVRRAGLCGKLTVSHAAAAPAGQPASFAWASGT